MAAELETMISEFCSIKMGDWIAGNTTDDFQFVRPTGNPIDKIGFPAMMTGDVVVQAGELKKIHKLEARRLRRTHRSRRARRSVCARRDPSPRESLETVSAVERTGFAPSPREPLARPSTVRAIAREPLARPSPWNRSRDRRPEPLATRLRPQVSGDMAFACLTQYGKFTYKGTPNEDICVMTLIFKKVDGAWKLAWAQRSSGRKPDEPAPSF
ncbi:DUF3804-containing protein [Aureococcus anophagefferens]|nr:DUF3804-containing protein [Aureococcus anophagefferens]